MTGFPGRISDSCSYFYVEVDKDVQLEFRIIIAVTDIFPQLMETRNRTRAHHCTAYKFVMPWQFFVLDQACPFELISAMQDDNGQGICNVFLGCDGSS